MRNIIVVFLFFLGIKSFAQKNANKGILIPNELISIALNCIELKEYYHFEKSERGNLIIINKSWLAQPLDTIVVNNKQIRIVDTLDSNQNNFIDIVSIKQERDKIEFIFKYKLEGITIWINLVKLNQKWQKEKVKVIEN